MQELLRAPAVDVNLANLHGWTPLAFACRHGHSQVVRSGAPPPPSASSSDVAAKNTSPTAVAAARGGVPPPAAAVVRSNGEY